MAPFSPGSTHPLPVVRYNYAFIVDASFEQARKIKCYLEKSKYL
jgi:hypothetical protein